MNSRRIVAIVGPTGIGKSRFAIWLAQKLDGEIVNADSRQVYRCMDVGTAKPSKYERSLVAHHLLDIIDPDEDFSLAQYQELAYKAISNIQQHGKIPFLVGGTGQYVWAVMEGWQIPTVPPNTEFRRQLEKRAAEGDAERLYKELLETDSSAAKKIDPRNVRRVIRALEVSKTIGVAFSKLQKKKAPPFEVDVIGLTADRSELYKRTDSRVDRMINDGLVKELKQLTEMGYGLDLPSMSGIGYRQIGDYLQGRTDLASAVQRIKSETHRFVRHQYNWFRLSDKRIKWFDVQDPNLDQRADIEVTEFLSRV